MPNFKEDKFNFICGTFGPFRPAKPATVPLWLAIYLKQRNKCQVQVPQWLDFDYLNKVKVIERELDEIFSEEIPYYYFEVATLFFNHCADEFQQVAKMKSIIEDIFELRKEKLVRILKNVDPKNPVKFLSNAGAVELNSVRPAFQSAHNVAGQM